VLERVVLAIGATCGLIALGWQLYAYSIRNAEQLDSHLGAKSTDGGKTVVIVLSVANLGEKPVYIKDAYLTYNDSNRNDRDELHFIPLMPEEHKIVILEPGSEQELRSDAWSPDYLSRFFHDSGDRVIVEVVTGRGKPVHYDHVNSFFLNILSQIPRMTDEERKAEFWWPYD
jgi:hypothetical protein